MNKDQSNPLKVANEEKHINPKELFKKIKELGFEDNSILFSDSSILTQLMDNPESLSSDLLPEGLGALETVVKTDEAYYDAEKDDACIKNYYQDLFFENLTPDKLFESLNKLLDTTHKERLRYSSAKQKLYREVDLYEDGKLRSIYSGKAFTKEELISMDKEVDLAREAALKMISDAMPRAVFLEKLDAIANANPYNCEHVIPQSWFNKKNPMVGDLHHLFACEIKCNAKRGNLPFYDFDDYNTQLGGIIEECGKREVGKFEPELNKGKVARVVLYFMVRYPGKFKNNYDEERLEMLKEWHKIERVSTYEKHRNYKIFQLQGNRNPFIDFPDLVDKIDLKKGLYEKAVL